MSQNTTPSPTCTNAVATKLSERDKVLIEFMINKHLLHVPFKLAVREAMQALSEMTELERNRVEDDLLASLTRNRDQAEYDYWKGM
jgi:hypothetical protein